MATFLTGNNITGLTNVVAVRMRSSDNAFWNTSGTPAFEAYNAANIANYAISSSEIGATGIYNASDPSDTTPGSYLMTTKSGGSLAVTDLPNLFWQDNAGPSPSNTLLIKGTSSAGTAGYVGLDWSAINAPTTTQGLTGTTISTSQTITSVSGAVGSVASTVNASVTQWSGTNVATPATAGIPEVNVKNINNVSSSSVTTINANQGTTQPLNFTGTAGSALVKSDMVDIAGSAVSASSAQIGVNVVNIKGTASAGAVGYVGIDWSAVNAPTTTNNLSGTTISTSQAIASVSGAVGSVTGAVGSVTGNVGGNVTGTVGSVSGNVGGNVVGSVASVAGNVSGSVASVVGNVGGSVASVVGAVGSVSGNIGGNVTGSVGSVLATVDASVIEWNGTTVATPATAGIPEVNVKNINNVATSFVTTINANQGTTQPVNYTGTGASALVKSDMVDIAGAAVSASTAQLGVNLVNIRGTTSAGQAGYVGIDWANIANPTATVDLANTTLDGSGGMVDANIVQWDGNNVHATNSDGVPVVDTRQLIRHGTAQALGSSTTAICLDTGASITNDYYVGMLIQVIEGTGTPEIAVCTGYNGTTKIATITPAWPAAPGNDSIFQIFPAMVDLETILTENLDVASSVNANVTQWDGTDVSEPATAGIPEVNVKNYNNYVAQTNSADLPMVAAAYLPPIPNNWITSAGIAANSLIGKGDWLPTTSYPDNFSILSINGSGEVVASGVTSFPPNFVDLLITPEGYVTVGTNLDKTGYSVSGGITFVLGSATPTIIYPVAMTGAVTLVQSIDYYAAEGRALTWTDSATNNAWPVLTGATITFSARYTDPVSNTVTFTQAGSLIVTTNPQQIQVQIPAASLASTGSGSYDVVASMLDGHVIELVRGSLTILSRP